MTLPAAADTAETPAPATPAYPLSVFPIEDHRGVPAMFAIRQFELAHEPLLIRLIDIDGCPLIGRTLVPPFLIPPVVETKSGAHALLTATALDNSIFSLRASAPIRKQMVTLVVVGIPQCLD